MLMNLKNTCVRMTVLAIMAIATLSTGVGCRELALRVATIGFTPSNSSASPEYVGAVVGQGDPSNGAPPSGNAGSSAQGTDCPAAGGCGYPGSSTYSRPSGSTAPVTPSWAGTSMGW